MRVEEFKANFQNGVRPNAYQFEVFGLPEKLKFLCKASQLPGKTIGNIDVFYMGAPIKIGGDRTFEDLTVTIMLDNDFSVRNELESWMRSIKGDDILTSDEPSLYKQTGSIVSIDNNDNEIAQYDFIGLWPNSLSPIELSFETNDTIAEYTVTFSMDYWLRVK